MPSSNVTWHAGQVGRAERARVLAQGSPGAGGATVWFTGLSGSGKSTLAIAVERRLVEQGRGAYRLDGDNLRTGLNGDLGFSQEERLENCRRVAEVAKLFADAGLVALVAVISPYERSRLEARRMHEAAGLGFVEVYLAASADCCAVRDPKGLYARASAGHIGSFTGVDDPYEVPESPDLTVGAETSVEDATAEVLAVLERAAGHHPTPGARS